MKQYFDEDVELIDNPKEIEYKENEISLKFKTNSGLFSKDEVDLQSAKLVYNIENKKYKNILDFGCGYGFIGIYLAKKHDAKIVFIDITTRACEYTRINCEYNNIKNYEVIQSDGIQVNEKFDLITLNPPIHVGKKKIYEMYLDAYSHLSKEGLFYIVIHKKHGAKSTIEYLKTITEKIEIVYKKKSLYIIKIERDN